MRKTNAQLPCKCTFERISYVLVVKRDPPLFGLERAQPGHRPLPPGGGAMYWHAQACTRARTPRAWKSSSQFCSSVVRPSIVLDPVEKPVRMSTSTESHAAFDLVGRPAALAPMPDTAGVRNEMQRELFPGKNLLLCTMTSSQSRQQQRSGFAKFRAL